MGARTTATARIGGVRSAGLVALCSASFLVVAAIVRGLVPPPTECYLQAKLRYYEATREQYDVVCIGSSQIFRSIVPELLDEQLAADSRKWSSFNLGIPGMLGFETDAYLARILEQPAERLALVVVELRAWSLDIDERANTRRTAYWHDLAQTRRALAYAETASADGEERRDNTLAHARMGALRFASIGLGVLFFEAPLDLRPAPDPMDRIELARARGYRPTERDQPARLEEFRRNYHVFERMVEVLDAGPEPDAGPSVAELELLRWRAELARRAGVRLVFVLPPVATRAPFRHSDWGDDLPPVFAYNYPSRYPELYTLEARADRPHLSEQGARLFTRRFGADLASYLDSTPKPPR